MMVNINASIGLGDASSHIEGYQNALSLINPDIEVAILKQQEVIREHKIQLQEFQIREMADPLALLDTWQYLDEGQLLKYFFKKRRQVKRINNELRLSKRKSSKKKY